jgi:hypothetical protein
MKSILRFFQNLFPCKWCEGRGGFHDITCLFVLASGIDPFSGIPFLYDYTVHVGFDAIKNQSKSIYLSP